MYSYEVLLCLVKGPICLVRGCREKLVCANRRSNIKDCAVWDGFVAGWWLFLGGETDCSQVLLSRYGHQKNS